MGLFDKVKKILFDEEEIEDLPVRNDKKQDDEESAAQASGGVIIHNEEDTITEVKVPEEKPSSLIFPVKDEDFEDTEEQEIEEINSRLEEDDINRTQEIERVQEQQLSRSKEDFINEYNETRRLQKETYEPRREVVNTPPRKENGPYRVPPVISPVFGVLDKNYDPDAYEETRQKITMVNSGNKSLLSERQFGPVSFNDQGIPVPKYHKETTVIITTNDSTKEMHEELKKEAEAIKEAKKIEDEIINTIINEETTSKDIEDAFDTKEVEPVVEEPTVKEEIIDEEPVIEESKPEVVEEVEEPTVEFKEPEEIDEDDDKVIEGSPYDEMLDSMNEEKEPTVDINELIKDVDEEEANVPVDKPKNIEENEALDDTIETDLYNLIDSMYKDED